MPKTKAHGRPPASQESLARTAAQLRGLGITQRGDFGEVAFVRQAMSLGYVVAKPYGQMHRYDFILQAATKKLALIQVKTSTCMRDGCYQLCIQRITHRRVVAYTASDFDFVAAYIIPEDAWFIIPISVIAGRRSFLLPSKYHPRRKNFLAPYREAWHLLGNPPNPAV